MPNNVTGIILCKNEGYNIIECINSLKEYLNEIIIVDSSDNDIISNSDDIIKRICNDLECKYYYKEMGKDGINGFADLRNFGQEMSSNEWCLHVDVDEIFSDEFLKNADNIIKGSYKWAFKFPRINLEWYEKYPDYQVRLTNKKNTEWIGKVHETVSIIDKPFEIDILEEYPIIHKKKENKLIINKRWKKEKDNYDILVISLINNCSKWIERFLLCLRELVIYERGRGNKVNVLFIEGNSNDNSYEMIYKWTDKNNIEIKKEIYRIIKMDINSKIPRFEKLAILRNMGIKIGINNRDYDYILMIDSDVIFDKNLVGVMIKSMDNNNCDVVSPFVGIENFRIYGNDYFYDILAYVYKGRNLSHFYPYVNDFYNENEFNVKNKILNMDSVGSCYLCKGQIYNINDFKDFNVEKCYEESKNKVLCLYDGEGKSEQVGFFNNVKKKGYKVITDMNIEVLHINLENYGETWH